MNPVSQSKKHTSLQQGYNHFSFSDMLVRVISLLLERACSFSIDSALYEYLCRFPMLVLGVADRTVKIAAKVRPEF